MTAPQTIAPAARTSRIIHASLIGGILLFGFICHFLLRPLLAPDVILSPSVVRILLGLSLAVCVTALLLRRRVPRRSTADSSDLFWTSATMPAMVTWALLEGATMLALFVYAATSSAAALAVAGVAVLLFALLNPGYLERAEDR
jgi:hypothetical protein